MKLIGSLMLAIAWAGSVTAARADEPYRFRGGEIDEMRAAAAQKATLPWSIAITDGFYRVFAAIGDRKTVRWPDREEGRLRRFVLQFEKGMRGEMQDDRIFVGSICLFAGNCTSWLFVDVQTGHAVLVLPWEHDDEGKYLKRSNILGFFHMSCANPELLGAVGRFAPKDSYQPFDKLEHRTYKTACR